MAKGFLTTHVLDTARGCPAAGGIRLFSVDGKRHQLAEMTTNSDGRTDSPILPADNFRCGSYQLVFAQVIICGRKGRQMTFCFWMR